MPPRTKDLRLADVQILRRALRDLPPAAAHQAADPPDLNELYAPEGHEGALDPERALVIGNRGAGKSFWSAVLADPRARRAVATQYRRLRLEHTDVALGFHEAAGKREGDKSPSPELLTALCAQATPAQIWRGVLLQALDPQLTGLSPPTKLTETLLWARDNLEDIEAGLRRADTRLHADKRRFVLVFDALDRLGADWPTIRSLSAGVLRFALDLRGYRALRAKIWMRSDQARDPHLFDFPDASKLRAESVELRWRRPDLYGLLFRRLWFHDDEKVREAFKRAIDGRSVRPDATEGQMPPGLRKDESIQEDVIATLAGPYMGTNHRRGRTYLWIHNHLADTFGETSPRSFLIALQRAANSVAEASTTAIDHHAIRIGVQEASIVRVDQLKEDYAWIDEALRPLADLEVPCPPKALLDAWKRNQTLEAILNLQSLQPLELFNVPSPDRGRALLQALISIGVLEERDDGRSNIPDIFRVAAKIKRRGGVPPVKQTARR
ncbi:MAG: hypothetical protein IPK80_03565 [Nannocystis sp.]|nr:hypothetical protein [Nannocystis sp.]